MATQGRQDARQWVTQYYVSYGQDGVYFAEYKKNSARKVRAQTKYILLVAVLIYSKTQVEIDGGLAPNQSESSIWTGEDLLLWKQWHTDDVIVTQVSQSHASVTQSATQSVTRSRKSRNPIKYYWYEA